MSDEIESSQEFKDAVSAAIAEATDGLKAKNNELLGKIKKLQQGQQIDPGDLEAAERERDEWKGKAQAADKLAAKAAKELADATKRADDTDKAYANTLRDSALTDALTKAGVTNPVHLKAAKALLAASAEVVDENGARVVKAGDKSISDFITEWAGSDEGKYFVLAPGTNGGGSQGGRGGGGAKTITREAFNGLDPMAQAAHFKDKGVVTD